VAARLKQFLISRCEAFLTDRKFSYDIVRAVSRVAWPEPARAVQRCRGFKAIRGDDAFERLIIGVKRVGNILGPDKKIYGAGWDSLERALSGSESLAGDIRFSAEAFTEPMERQLLEAVRQRLAEVMENDRDDDFLGVLKTLASLGPVIDDYFDAVLVNCEDTAVRANRFNFLAATFALFSRYADFSLIVEINPPTA
jgi:glycyl-tRNA synthetase beta chain